MKKNYKMIISYDGSRYHGWENQPGVEMTIQGKLNQVFSRLAGTEVEVIGAGRTDAGVHARGMTANVHLDVPYTEEEILQYANRYLPDDICITELKTASDRFHSRYLATGKTYCYTCYVGDRKPVFQRKYVYIPDGVPDIPRMRQAASYLKGEHDFASFSHNPRMKKSTVREIYDIRIEKKGPMLTFTYHGSGFLQYMVRILTGTLLEVGLGLREPDSIPELLQARNRSLAGFTAPAKGLCLMKVDYQ